MRTGNVCNFPYSPPHSITALSAADCTMTYGQMLGPGFIALNLVLCASFFGALCVTSVRLWRIKRECEERRQPIWEHLYFGHYVFSVLFCLFWTFATADLFGFWGVFPPNFVLFNDECGGACTFSNGILATHFIYKVAAGVKKIDAGTILAARLSKGMLVLTWVFYLVCVALISADPDNYQTYECIKMFGGAAILCSIFITTIYFGRLIRKSLLLSVTLTPQSQQEENLKMVRTLECKQLRLLILVVIGIVVFVANGILVSANTSSQWIVPLAGQPDPVQIAFKVAGFLHVVFICYVFRVSPPSDKSKDSTPSMNPSRASALVPRFSSFGPRVTRLASAREDTFNCLEDPQGVPLDPSVTLSNSAATIEVIVVAATEVVAPPETVA